MPTSSINPQTIAAAAMTNKLAGERVYTSLTIDYPNTGDSECDLILALKQVISSLKSANKSTIAVLDYLSRLYTEQENAWRQGQDSFAQMQGSVGSGGMPAQAQTPNDFYHGLGNLGAIPPYSVVNTANWNPSGHP